MGAAAAKSQNHALSYRLFVAINQNDLQKASNILLKGADVNCTNFIGGTPLMELCKSKEHDEAQRTTFVKLLLENGADIMISDIYGWTALLYAQKNGHESIARILHRIESRASIIEKRGKFNVHVVYRISGWRRNNENNTTSPNDGHELHLF
jgi:ankyrin repeat protein